MQTAIEHPIQHCNKSVTRFVLVSLLLLLQLFSHSSSVDEKNHKVDSIKQTLSTRLNDTIRIEALQALASLIKFKHPNEAMQYTNEAEQLAKQLNDSKRKASSQYFKGNIYHSTADYSRALLNYFQALRFYEFIKDPVYTSRIKNDIAACYFMVGQNDLAQKYCLEAIQIRLEHNLTKGLGQSYNNLGLIYVNMGNTQDGIMYFSKAAKVFGHHTVSLNINLGEAYSKLTQFNKAEYYYKTALKELMTDERNVYDLLTCYQGLGQLYIKKQSFREAENYLFMAKDIAESTGISLTRESIYASIVNLYEMQTNHQKAHVYNKQLMELKDSLFKENMAKQLSEMQVKYELVQKNREIESLNKDKELSDAKAYKEKIIRYSFITLFIFVLSVVLILTRNVLHKQKANRILVSKNEKIEQQRIEIEQKKVEIEDKNDQLNQFNKELIEDNIYARYEVLKSKVNPHFLFNSLSTLASLTLKNPEKAFLFVSKFSQLYRTIIATSELPLIPLQKEIQLVKDYLFLQQIRFEKNLSITFDVSTTEKALFVPPFALQILVENALKHNIISSKSPLNIHIQISNTQIIVSNPIKKRKNILESTGFGLKNLTDRYKLLSEAKPAFEEQESIYIASIPIVHSVHT